MAKGTPVKFTSGDFAGLTGTFEWAGQREGLVRVCILVPWQSWMGQPAGSRWLWGRPAEVEVS